MRLTRMPRVPSKSRLTWRIARLQLDETGRFWWATACKGGRVAVVRLPPLLEWASEDAWLEGIEAAFEKNSHDPTCDGTAGNSGTGDWGT